MDKIAFSGVHGSGRTSILNEVKKILSMKSRVEDVPDLTASSPFDFNLKTCFISQFYFMSQQINEENIRSLLQPDYLLCDCSMLDHWLQWQHSLAEKKTGKSSDEKKSLLKNLFQFWIPSYAMIFRLRVEAKELKERAAGSGLHDHEPEQSQPPDELYTRVIQSHRLHVHDIWNQKSIDESAQEILKKIAELKLL